MGGLYKILVKLLANRMKKVFGKVIDNCQSAFIEGRQLLRSVVVANEVLEEAHREKMSFFSKYILKRHMIPCHGNSFYIC